MQIPSLRFKSLHLPGKAESLRQEVRDFVAGAMLPGIRPNSDFGTGSSPEFSRRLGERSWIGMTWPRRFGGSESSFLERYVVTEELLAAGAPVGSHWIADRQTGPLLLKYGTEAQCREYLPRIARGEIFFSIGMSEPDSGSDLASVRTTATAVAGGWHLNGAKLWSSEAHRNHYMIALVRSDPDSTRHAGLSQFIVDLRSPDVKVRPIRNLAGDEDFAEIVFQDTFLAEDALVGQQGNGWQQVISELGYERSGPERFLSAFRLMVEFVRAVGDSTDRRLTETIGRLVAHLSTLRHLSISVAGMLEADDEPPIVQAALVKDLGNVFEQQVPELLRLCVDASTCPQSLRQTLYETVLHAPSFSIRGGTREILRGMIARGLGLR